MKTLILETLNVAISFHSDDEFKVIANKALEDAFSECMGYLTVASLEDGSKVINFILDSDMDNENLLPPISEIVASPGNHYSMDDVEPDSANETSDLIRENRINAAKDILEMEGFFTDSLEHVNHYMNMYGCDEKTAREVLEQVLMEDEYIGQTINEAIEDEFTNMGYAQKEDH